MAIGEHPDDPVPDPGSAAADAVAAAAAGGRPDTAAVRRECAAQLALVEELTDGLRDDATDHDRWTLDCVREHAQQLRAVADLIEVGDLAGARAQLQAALLVAIDPTPDAPPTPG